MRTNELARVMERLAARTPMRFDCGRLCGSACCRPTDEDKGMILFPGEEELLCFPCGWYRRQENLPGWGKVTIITCGGDCVRECRPLSCRIFPLGPHKTEDGFRAVLDPRGRPVCPLAHGRMQALDSRFVTTVEESFAALAQDPEMNRFLTALSDHIEEYRQLDRMLHFPSSV